MAKGIRALLDTVIQALPQVGNLGLLFFLLFFIFAALGVELFGRLGKNPLEVRCIYSKNSTTRTRWLVCRIDSKSFLSPWEVLPIAQEKKHLGIF